MNPRLRLLLHAWLQTGLIALLAAVSVHLAAGLSWRFDMTSDQRHSLSGPALDAVRSLDKPAHMTVWFTQDLGPPYHTHRQALMDVVTELQVASRGMLDVTVRDPTGDAEAARQAQEAGIRPVTWAVRDWDQTQARQVWMGVSLDHAERHAAVDALPDVATMEHDVVRALLSVTTETEDRRTVGWVTGHGEPALQGWAADHPLGKLLGAVAARHTLVPVALNQPVDPQVDALLWVGPQSAVGDVERWHFDQFLMRGGAASLFLSSWQPDFQAMTLRPTRHGLGPQLASYGVGLQSDLLLDRRRNEAIVVPVRGALARVNHPLAPKTANLDRRQASVRGLTGAVLPFASSLSEAPTLADVRRATWLSTEPTAISAPTVTSLDPAVLARPLPGETPGPHGVVLGVEGELMTAFAGGPPSLPAGVAAAEPRSTSQPTRLLVAGSADMVANNLPLVLNGLDWLLADTRLVSIRARDSGPEPLRPLERDQALRWKLAMAGLPLMLLALLGGWVGWRRRQR